MINVKNLHKYLWMTLIAIILSACSGGSCISNNNNNLNLAISGPLQYFANQPESTYVTFQVTNLSNIDAKNVSYSVPNQTNQTKPTGYSSSQTNIHFKPNECSSIPAGKSCNLSASIDAWSNPGIFYVVGSATNNNQNTKLSTQSALEQNTVSVTSNVSLNGQPPTCGQSGQLFCILSVNTVNASESKPYKTIYVSVMNESNVAYDNFNLVNGNNTSYNTTLIGALTTRQYGINTYQTQLPNNPNATVTIQATASDQDTPICSSNCSNSQPVTIMPSSAGTLLVQPDNINMGESYTSQIITFSNIGNAPISGLTIPTLAAPFSIAPNSNTCTANLATGASCQLTLVYTPGSTSGSGSFVVGYNNSLRTVNTAITISYQGSSPAGYAVLTTSPTSFTLNVNNPSQVITISNTGTAPATSLTLPTLVAPLTESSTTCTGTLAENSSCTYTLYVDYSQSQSAGSESVVFSYNNGQQNQTTTVATDWDAGSSIVTYAYIADQGGGLMQCLANNTDGSLTNCQNTSPPPLYWSVMGVGLTTINNAPYLYTMNYNTGADYSCPLSESGVINDYSTCVNVLGENFININFQNVQNTTYAYLAGNVFGPNNDGPGQICTINPDTTLNCNDDIASGVTTAQQILTSTVNGTLYAYILDFNNNAIVKCNVSNNDGTFTNCTNTPSVSGPWAQLWSIAITQIGGNYYAYVADKNSTQVYSCNVSAQDGSLSNCIITNDNGLGWGPMGLTVRTIGSSQYLYVSDNNSNSLDYCSINSNDGSLSNCQNTNSGSSRNVVFGTFVYSN